MNNENLTPDLGAVEPKRERYQSVRGRPTKFRPELVQMLKDHFSVDPITEFEAEHKVEYNRDGSIKSESRKKIRVPKRLPTLVSFGQLVDIDYYTLYRWAVEGQLLKGDYGDANQDEIEDIDKALIDFSEEYKSCILRQKQFLLDIGLGGVTPPASFIFTAKNLTDMKDKIETENTTKNINFTIPLEVAQKHNMEIAKDIQPVLIDEKRQEEEPEIELPN